MVAEPGQHCDTALNKKECVASLCYLCTEMKFQAIIFSWAEDQSVTCDWTANCQFQKVGAYVTVFELSLGWWCLNSKTALVKDSVLFSIALRGLFHQDHGRSTTFHGKRDFSFTAHFTIKLNESLAELNIKASPV